MAITAPITSTTAIGYIIAPPPWKKRTIMLKNCITRLPCLNQATKSKTARRPSWRRRAGGRGCRRRQHRLRGGIGLQRREIAVLPAEHVTVDRRKRLVDQALCRSPAQVAQLGSLP